MADTLGKKISELAETTELAGLYTIGSDKNNQSKKVSLQFVKEAADYANAQGDYAKQIGDTVAGNVGVDEYPAFNASKQYAAGDVVNYNGKLYRFTSVHAAGAWVGTDVTETSIKAETDVKLTELESKEMRYHRNPSFEANGRLTTALLSLDGYYKIENGVLVFVSSSTWQCGIFPCSKYGYIETCSSSGISTKIPAIAYLNDENENSLIIGSEEYGKEGDSTNVKTFRGEIDASKGNYFLINFNVPYGLSQNLMMYEKTIIKSAFAEQTQRLDRTDERLDRTDERLDRTDERLDRTDKSLTNLQNPYHPEFIRCNVTLDGDITSVTDEYEVGILQADGVKNEAFSTYRIYALTNNTNVFKFVKSFHNGNITASFCTIAIFDSDNKLVYQSRLHGEQIVAIPSGYSAKFSQGKNFGISYSESVQELINPLEESIKGITDSVNPWKGKSIVWYGTSIPVQGYPQIVGDLLGATCINEALGSSMARRGILSYTDDELTDKYGVTGLAWQNICYSLTMSQEEKHDIFLNWTTERRKTNLLNKGYSAEDVENVVGYAEMMKGNFYGEETDESNVTAPTSKPSDIMMDNYISFRKECYGYCYDTTTNIESGFGTITGKIDRYLNWDSIPDLFVLDHGHNDNFASDTTSEFISVPSDFENRNTYIGAINFIIQRILNFNPRQRILMISHYNESDGYERIMEAQKVLQKLWGFPLCDIANSLQMSKDRVVTTNGYWDKNKIWHNSGYNGTNGYDGWRNTKIPENPRQINGVWVHDISLLNAWMIDNLHPSTQDVKEYEAQNIALYIKNNL